MRKTALLLAATLLFSSMVAAQTTGAKPGLAPGNPFYAVEKFVEDIEVGIAGVIGGEDLKAKAMANNAEERLAEAQKMKKKHRTEKAEKLAERYTDTINRSRDIAERSENRQLGDRIDEIKGKNTEVLEQVRKKAPDQANKGLDKAIRKSNNTLGKPDLNRTGNADNGSRAPEKVKNRTEKKLPEINTTGKDSSKKGKLRNQSNETIQDLENRTKRNKSLSNNTKEELEEDENSITGQATASLDRKSGESSDSLEENKTAGKKDGKVKSGKNSGDRVTGLD